MKVTEQKWDGQREKHFDQREHKSSEAVESVACLKNSKKASELENRERERWGECMMREVR